MTQQNSAVSIYATYTKDMLVDEYGTLVTSQNGGPAFFLERAFKRAGVDFALNGRCDMEVEIKVTENGEFGRILTTPQPQVISFSEITAPYVLISSVLDEFDLSRVSDYQGKVFLDIQGYVRDGRDFGKKKVWEQDSAILSNIFCLKGTKEEVSYLPEQFREAQKLKILLVTDGTNGCEVFAFGKSIRVQLERIVNSEDTIGAGDTCMAHFVMSYIQSGDIQRSVRQATERTADFLLQKNVHHQNQFFREEIGGV